MTLIFGGFKLYFPLHCFACSAFRVVDTHKCHDVLKWLRSFSICVAILNCLRP
jgi:hypothetical protein